VSIGCDHGKHTNLKILKKKKQKTKGRQEIAAQKNAH
jgi:hypothetical protein